MMQYCIYLYHDKVNAYMILCLVLMAGTQPVGWLLRTPIHPTRASWLFLVRLTLVISMATGAGTHFRRFSRRRVHFKPYAHCPAMLAA
jgi:hypothetical protein